jgi:hypothetical protein
MKRIKKIASNSPFVNNGKELPYKKNEEEIRNYNNV